MNLPSFVETLKTLRDKELFEAFDRYKRTHGRWHKLTSAIVAELEDRGYEAEPIVTAEDLTEWQNASVGII